MCIQVIFSGDAHNIYGGEMIVSSINDVGKTGFPHAKEQSCTLILYHMQKSTGNVLKT